MCVSERERKKSSEAKQRDATKLNIHTEKLVLKYIRQEPVTMKKQTCSKPSLSLD